MTASTPQLPWRKSTYSADQGGNCVEAASLAGFVMVGDSKVRSRDRAFYVSMSSAEWVCLTDAVRAGFFDRDS